MLYMVVTTNAIQRAHGERSVFLVTPDRAEAEAVAARRDGYESWYSGRTEATVETTREVWVNFPLKPNAQYISLSEMWQRAVNGVLDSDGFAITADEECWRHEYSRSVGENWKLVAYARLRYRWQKESSENLLTNRT